jgi:hypothetical protein
MPTPWNEQGCEVCRLGWLQGHHPTTLFVDPPGHVMVHRCDECQSVWVETEREAHVMTHDEVDYYEKELGSA